MPFKPDATKWTIPLEEKFYNAKDYPDYLSNSLFHHSDKGCKVIMVMDNTPSSCRQRNYFINKICVSHNKVCSKTGWELGRYLGTISKPIPICSKCGNEYEKKGGKTCYCPDCRKIVAHDYQVNRWNRLKLLK